MLVPSFAAPSFTAQYGQHLPPEITSSIIFTLYHDKAFGALAKLQRTCKAFYGIFTPLIYRHIHLDRQTLHGLMCQFLVKDADSEEWWVPQDWYKKENMAPTVDPLDLDMMDVPFQVRMRSLLALVESITVPHSVNSITQDPFTNKIHAIASSVWSSTNQRLFPNLKYLCLQGTPFQPIAVGPVSIFLGSASEPTHLCLHYPEACTNIPSLLCQKDNTVTNLTIHNSCGVELPILSQVDLTMIYMSITCDPSCEKSRDRNGLCSGHSAEYKARQLFSAGIKQATLSNRDAKTWKIGMVAETPSKAAEELQKIRMEFKRLVVESCGNLDAVSSRNKDVELKKGTRAYIRQCAKQFVDNLRWLTPDELKHEPDCEICGDLIPQGNLCNRSLRSPLPEFTSPITNHAATSLIHSSIMYTTNNMNFHLTARALHHFVRQIFDTSLGLQPPLLPKDYNHSDYMGSLIDLDTCRVPTQDVSPSRWIRSLFTHIKRISLTFDKGQIDPVVHHCLSHLTSFARSVHLHTNDFLFPNLTSVSLSPASPNGTIPVYPLSLFLREACQPSHLHIERPHRDPGLGHFVLLIKGSVQSAKLLDVNIHYLPSAGSVRLKIRYLKAKCGNMCSSPDHQFQVGFPFTCRFATYLQRGKKLFNACISSKVGLDDWKEWNIVHGDEGECEEGISRMVDHLKHLVQEISDWVYEGFNGDDDIYWEGVSDDEREEFLKRGRKFVETLKVINENR
ncbi:hypothetical protein L486_00175 [Kwoniella mangroviensis CBS 10435]|uniref:F-box domain-containing protein n=1 Tax=Kwoniella mangroviensis CBS 10435 TaxID=1331196 RepID=A0A1B9IYE3_9TREE|nr:hypothetical protein L486_00175 [Kwoniella mangroviensis CBS 10435]